MQNALERLEFPEIFIGIVAPVGVDTKPTIQAIRQYFSRNEYDVFEIRVTDYFQNIKKALSIDLPLSPKPADKRIGEYINFGNKVREKFTDDSVLAAYTIFRLAKLRSREFTRKKQISYQNKVYILHQFKRPEEIELLRSVYGRLFYQISVYSKRSSRINHLTYRISHDHDSADHLAFNPVASELIATDENEKKNTHGQRVSKLFHQADFIVNGDTPENDGVEKQIDRFLELLFSSNQISPNKQEYGMFAAKAAALRTLDLSRQVGAAIFRPSGEIISMGSNEVPKASGGTYWCDELPYDAREYTRQTDSNDSRKREILSEIFKATGSNMSFDDFLKLEDVKESQFMDALEYGRIVHAEMSAIVDAARLGVSLAGATLFCTTFPCHMCAKHIAAAGIKRVIFLEPYPKSLASDLHPDSLEIEGGSRGRYDSYDAVKFEHFYGVTPRIYRELFERGSRKSDGVFESYIKGNKRPNVHLLAPYYAEFETRVIKRGFEAYEEILAKRQKEQEETS